MNKSLRKIKDFGIKNYIENKIFKFSKNIFISFFLKNSDGFVLTKYKVWMKENWNDNTFIFCYFGSYGKYLSNILETFNKDYVFLDIGANQGLYSLISAKSNFCRNVLSYEPVCSTFKLLNENIKKNLFNEKIISINAGISSENKEAKIFFNENHSGEASLTNNTSTNSETIKLINHSVLNEQIENDHDLIVKIDVEGHEEVVINELCKIDKTNNIKIIVYEIDERWTNHKNIKNILMQQGFKSFEKIGSGKHYDIVAKR